MRIVLVEPYFAGSHKSWAESYASHSAHHIELLTMNGSYWKWRMHGGAITLAKQFNGLEQLPDLILASDMLDLTTFKSLTCRKSHNIPAAVYFHENQLTYPWSPTDRDIEKKRDHHYGFINYASALAADRNFFNSQYHLSSFTDALQPFLKGFPDKNELGTIDEITHKSEVLHLGMDLKRYDQYIDAAKRDQNRAVILWNHRWEYDKNPDQFFDVLYELKERGVEFKLILIGKNYSKQPMVFEKAREQFGDAILHYGYTDSWSDYARLIAEADILPVTSNQDFFGGSVVEAIYANTIPLLPQRLAYPEHLPETLHPTYFYENQKELTDRLQRLIFNVRILRKQQLSHYVSHYDWSVMAPKYDERFEALIREF